MDGATFESWVIFAVFGILGAFALRGVRGRWGLAFLLPLLVVSSSFGQGAPQPSIVLNASRNGSWFGGSSTHMYLPAWRLAADGAFILTSGQAAGGPFPLTWPLVRYGGGGDEETYWYGVLALYRYPATSGNPYGPPDMSDTKRVGCYVTVVGGEVNVFINTNGGAFSQVMVGHNLGASGVLAGIGYRGNRHFDNSFVQEFTGPFVGSTSQELCYLEIVGLSFDAGGASTQPTTAPGPTAVIPPTTSPSDVATSMPWFEQGEKALFGESAELQEGTFEKLRDQIKALPSTMPTGYALPFNTMQGFLQSGVASSQPAVDLVEAIHEMDADWFQTIGTDGGGSEMVQTVKGFLNSLLFSPTSSGSVPGLLPSVIVKFEALRTAPTNGFNLAALFTFIKLGGTVLLLWTTLLNVVDWLCWGFGVDARPFTNYFSVGGWGKAFSDHRHDAEALVLDDGPGVEADVLFDGNVIDLEDDDE